jgi:predicted nucleotidyltransferase
VPDTPANVDRPPGDGRPDASGEGLDARVARVVAALDGVGTAALFGSHARNRARPNSDLDVAILPTTADPTCRRRLVTRAAAALSGLVPSGRVDVVLVDEAPELLRQRIFKHGRVVLQRNPADWRAWRVRTMREHGDREPYRRMLRNAQARRLAAGRIGGRSGRALDSLERARGLSG